MPREGDAFTRRRRESLAKKEERVGLGGGRDDTLTRVGVEITRVSRSGSNLVDYHNQSMSLIYKLNKLLYNM